MTDGSSFFKGLAVTAGLGAAFAIGTAVGMTSGTPSLPDGFDDAAKVGQLTQVQAKIACFRAQAAINTEITTVRGTNKFAPRQNVDFHCFDAAVTTDATSAPLTPVP